MIPASPLGILLGSLLLCLSYGCIGGVLCLFGGLCIPNARRFMHRYWLRFTMLGIAMALGSLPLIKIVSGAVARTQAEERFERLRDIDLERDEVVGEIRLPAGSRLRLARPEVDPSDEHLPYGLASIEDVQFNPSSRVRGLLATRLELDESFWPGDTLSVQGRLFLAEDQQVDGWPCAASEPVSFEYFPSQRLHPDRWLLSECLLQGSRRIGGVFWPMGTRLSRLEDGWELQSMGHRGALEHAGLHLERLRMAFDADRSIRGWSGNLSQPAVLGGIRYPEGSNVESPRLGYLLVSSDMAVELQTGRALKAGQHVLHGAAGEVLDVYSPEQMTRFDWDSLP